MQNLGRLTRTLAAAAALLTAAPAGAVTAIMQPADTGISNARLSSSPTATLRINGYNIATFYVQLTRAAASSVQMSCSSGPTAAILAPISVANVNPVSGSIAMVPAAWSYPVTASGMVRMSVAPLNDTYLVCRFSAPDASTDTISLYAQLGG